MMARYRGKTTCPTCHGTRLKKEASYVKIGGRSISDLVDLPIYDLRDFFRNLKFTEREEKIANRLMEEINSRLQFLCDVGLQYLTLNRLSNSLSGGESQRINLATSLGSSLVGSLYILDEPSIGLHSRDTDKLVKVLRQLQQSGDKPYMTTEQILMEHVIDLEAKYATLYQKHKKLKKNYKELHEDIYFDENDGEQATMKQTTKPKRDEEPQEDEQEEEQQQTQFSVPQQSYNIDNNNYINKLRRPQKGYRRMMAGLM